MYMQLWKRNLLWFCMQYTIVVGLFPVGDSDTEAVWMADGHYQGGGGERHKRSGLSAHIYHAVPTKVWP